mmetsp:Transcript_78868/g.209431  ORF Transcript_78868/g.209431 Transcript_78868/m.209431 type:complete len:144 (-) Transcript_78868:5-436(-)
MLSDAFAAAGPGVDARLVAVLHEKIDKEVAGFAKWWPHDLVHDPSKGFYKALFGGELCTSSISGFLLQLVNPWSKFSGNRGKLTDSPIGEDHNMKGDGLTHGGLVVVRPLGTGIAYQFAEETIGDAALPEQVVQCTRAASSRM